MAEVDESGEGFEAHFGVVHPDQQPPEGQAALGPNGHALFILHLQLQQTQACPNNEPNSVYLKLEKQQPFMGQNDDLIQSGHSLISNGGQFFI